MIDTTVVRKARIGSGLFAGRAFETGKTIGHITGRIVAADLLWDVGGTFADNCYRFGPETYLDPLDGPARYVNHSCEPNAGIRKHANRLYLFAAKRIARHAEILIDYSTILGDDDIWTMRCQCGEPACRKTVRRFGTLSAARQRAYVEREMVPGFILQTLDARG